MFLDGVSHHEGVVVGVIFISPYGAIFPYFFTLIENFSNNITKYQTLILGLEIAMDIKRRQTKVFVDLKLIINQLFSIYKVKKLESIPYYRYVLDLL